MTGQFYATQPEDLLSRKERLALSGLEFMERMLDGRLAHPPIARILNFCLKSVQPGRVVFVGTPGFEATNPMGTVHGGWYGAILDSAMACAVMTKIAAGQEYTTLEYKVNMTRPVPVGSEARAEGIVVHAGKSTAVAEARLTTVQGKLCAFAVTTCLIIG